MHVSRRKFIRTASGTLGIAAAAGSSVSLPSAAAQQSSNLTYDEPEEQRRGDMVFRRLGTTGESVSLVGLGGNHIGKQADENDSIHLVGSKQKETDQEWQTRMYEPRQVQRNPLNV